MKKISLLFLFFLILFIFLVPNKKDGHFISDPNLFKDLFKPEGVQILNFGDVMFDRGVRNIMENRARDPFEYIKKDLNLFNDYDIRIVNLEGPIVTMERGLCQQKDYNFQFATDTPARLQSIGINMVSIANNHSYDCFKEGFENTKKVLENSGISYMGDSVSENSFIVKVIDGKKIAFLGIDETVQVVPVSSFYPLIKKLDSENDLVVINIHWGTEYKLVSSDKQKSIAHKLIDSGADVVFGHHPHVIQEVEVYKNKSIFYSLGNFVFDQNFGDTNKGLGVGVEFLEDKTTFTLYPFNIKAFAPSLMKEEERENFCKKYLEDFINKDCSFEIKL